MSDTLNILSMLVILVLGVVTLRSLTAYACERRRIWKTREKYGIPKHMKIREQRIITPLDEDMDFRSKLDRINWDERRIFLNDLEETGKYFDRDVEDQLDALCKEIFPDMEPYAARSRFRWLPSAPLGDNGRWVQTHDEAGTPVDINFEKGGHHDVS